MRKADPASLFLDTRFYDALDRLVLEVDNAGHATDLRYDGLGRLALRADSRGRNAAGRSLPRRSPGASPATVAANDYGNVTLTNYDALGRRVREDKVLTASGTGDGLHLGLQSGDWLAGGGSGVPVPGLQPLAWRAFPTTSTYAPDMARLAAESVPLLPDAKTGLDHPGQGGGDGLITVRYEYDVAGRLEALIDDNGNETDWQYDCLGRKISETKGEPGSPASGGANLAEVHPAPTTIDWSFDASTGYLDHMTREDGSVLTYTYDGRDAGRLVSVSVTSPPSEDNPPLAGTTVQTFTYDGPGHRIASTDNNASGDETDCAWRYDSLGRMIEESQKFGPAGTPGVFSYQYQANDRAALVYPNGRRTDFTYHYPGGPLKAQSDDGAPAPTTQYDYLGGRTLVRAMQNGVNLDLRDGSGGAWFDATGRPTQWLHKDTNHAGSPTKIGFEYAYDGNGNKLYQKSVHDPLDSQRYAYDSADRLTAFSRGPFGALPEGFCGPSTGTWPGQDLYQGWDLDGLGNWSHYTHQTAGAAAAVETRTDDTFNAYARVGEDANGQGGVAQTHDPNGNLTNDGRRAFKWDAFNRLREVWTTTGTLVATYTYDTVGRRLKKIVQPGFPGESTVYRFADWRIMEESTPASPNTTKRQYTYGNYLDEVLTMDTDLTTNGLCTDPADRRLFYDQNNLFSVYALTDRLGNVVEGYEYDPYGKHTLILDGPDADAVVNFDATDRRYAAESLCATSPSGNTRTFTGKPYDCESGLYWWNLRFYDAAGGRFISLDPLGDIDGEDFYAAYFAMYGGLDPSGLFSLKDVLKVGLTLSEAPREWEIFRTPLGPGFLVLTASVSGRIFDCSCNGEIQTWGQVSGGVELFYQLGLSQTDNPSGKGRDRNKLIPHPCKPGQMIKQKYYAKALEDCLKGSTGGPGAGKKSGSCAAPCPARGLSGSGELFARFVGGIGFGLGVNAEVDYELHLDNPIDAKYFRFSGGVGTASRGISVDAGGRGSANYSGPIGGL